MNVIPWLLDSDPSIRWQVMRDLLDEPAEVVARERARVAIEGWGARLLQLQQPDGHWGGASFVPRCWLSTSDTLLQLKQLGVDPASQAVRRAVALVHSKCDWGPEFGNSPFFEGEIEPCINGRVLAMGAYFGHPSERLATRLLGEQLEDGGWNCYAPPSSRSSFHSTICVLEGLIEYEKSQGPTPGLTAARLRGQQYLLDRKMFRSLSTGEVIKSAWMQFSFPAYWHYDVLRGLDYLRTAGVEPCPQLEEALQLVEKKRDRHGRWPVENPHPGAVHVPLEHADGEGSRWNTLRALRVLRWYRGTFRI